MEKRPNKMIYDLYVDGGYRDLRTVSAFAIYKSEDLIYYESSNVYDSRFWQVAGELQAVLDGLNLACNYSLHNINVCYDYTGIYCWAVKEWKARNVVTLKYQKQVQKYLADLNISWQKIKAHSNNKKNNFVDSLVKQALNNKLHYFNEIKKPTYV